MTQRHSASENRRVPNSQAASALAHDELTEAGCRSVTTETPHRTRGTWIVPALGEDGGGVESNWRVHIDPRSGATRIVQANG